MGLVVKGHFKYNFITNPDERLAHFTLSTSNTRTLEHLNIWTFEHLSILANPHM